MATLVAGAAAFTATSAAAAPLCVPSGKSVDWLKANEAAGGHAIACHVGKTEKNLLGRIKGTPEPGKTCQSGTPAASSFTDVNSAAGFIAATVTGHPNEVRNWLALPAGANLVLNGASKGSNVGIVMAPEAKKGKGTCSVVGGYDCNKAKTFAVVLARVAGANVCVVRTAYPI